MKRVIIRKKHKKCIVQKKEKGFVMCRKLNELKGKSAEDLLKLLGDFPGYSIDILEILHRLEIEAISVDFSEVEEKYKNIVAQRGKILGAVFLDKDDLSIYYRSGETKNRTRFTIAHELAHCCLHASSLSNGHVEFRMDEVSEKKDEYDANIFAGQLLIPQRLLQKAYDQMGITPLSDVLANTFNVSTNVMEKRLDYLNLSYYKPIVRKA